jgi:hypothetical protein
MFRHLLPSIFHVSSGNFLVCLTHSDAYTSLSRKAVLVDMDMCSIHLLVGLYLHIVLCTSLISVAQRLNDGLMVIMVDLV